MNNEKLFASLRRTLFKRGFNQGQVDGINGILVAMDQVGDNDKDTLAYALATAYHETGKRMVPVREGFATSDVGARRAVNNLAKKRGPKSAVAKYAKPTGPYGHVYYGRGHVQLTWEENYTKASKIAGVDLVKYPDKMLDPTISARVLIHGLVTGQWGGGKGIGEYEGEDDFLDTTEATKVRKTVNGTDKAALIAGYHKAFYEALTEAGWQPKKKIKDNGAAGVATGIGVVSGIFLIWEDIKNLAEWVLSLWPF
jgi:predicted chitinase